MKYKTRGIYKILAVLTALLLQFAFISSPVYAAETSTEAAAAVADLDLTQTGSISVTLKTGEGDTATDGTLTFYKVADLKIEDGDMVYALTDEFKDSGVDVSDVDEADTNADLAKTLKTWIADKSITGTEATINANGTASISNLGLGLYLVDQTTASTGYYAVNAFLVSVPSDTDGVWIYNVDASPKTELLTEIPVEPPVETPPEEPPVEEPPVEEPPVEEEPPEEIIHTGQLNWPIPVLLIISVVCLIFGVRYIKNEDKRDEEKKEN